MVKKLLATIGFLFLTSTTFAQGGGQFGNGTGSGGSGTVTSVTGTTNQIDVATGTTTPVISLDAAIAFPGTWSMATAGAASTSPATMTGTPFVGTGTTSTPLFYFNGGIAPTTWNNTASGGTYFGINAISGFAGNFLDFRVNGGASSFNVTNQGNINANVITAVNNVVAGSANNIGFTSRSFFGSPSNGVMNEVNNAATGFTRHTFGPDTSAFPGACPITGTTPYLAFDVGGGCSTATFIKTAQTLQVTASDFTCSTGCTSLATITGLSVALPTVATNWSFQCDLIISQATAAATDQIGVQTATNASTNLAATAIAYTAAAVSTSGSVVTASSTSSQSVLTFTPGATGTNLPLHLAGTVEGTSTSGTTLNIQILTGSSSDAITVRRGSACHVY